MHPERPSAPFAVNQIVHKRNDRLETDMATVVKHKVPIIITSLGVREADFDRWQRDWNVKVMAHAYAAKAVLPSMIARREGYLLQTLSAASLPPRMP